MQLITAAKGITLLIKLGNILCLYLTVSPFSFIFIVFSYREAALARASSSTTSNFFTKRSGSKPNAGSTTNASSLRVNQPRAFAAAAVQGNLVCSIHYCRYMHIGSLIMFFFSLPK